MPSGPMVAHLISIVYILILFSPFVSSTIQFSIQGQARAQSDVTVSWSRLPTDSPLSAIAKVKIDEPTPLTSPPIQIINPEKTSGTLLVFFNRAGNFRLIAYDSDRNILANSDTFGVQPPIGLSSAGSSTATASASSTTASSLTPSVSVPPPKPSNSTPATTTSGASSLPNTSIIVSCAVGGVFLLFFIGLLLYLILCRRILRQRKSEASAAEQGQWIKPFFSRSQTGSDKATPGHSARSLPGDVEKQPDFAASVKPPHMTQPISNGYPFKKNRRITATTFGSIGTEISSIRFNPQTGRQIEMDSRINKLNAKLEQLDARAQSGQDDSAVKAAMLRGLIEQLAKLKESPYALGQTDEVPPGWR